MGPGGGKAGFWRSVSLALVVFALAIKVLVPPGFMVAADSHAFPLVICAADPGRPRRSEGAVPQDIGCPMRLRRLGDAADAYGHGDRRGTCRDIG